MLGARSAGELARTSGTSLRTLAIATRAACRPAVEDRLAALDSRTGCRRRRRGRRNDCRFIHRPRACLRHHHAARRRCRRRGCCWAVVMGRRRCAVYGSNRRRFRSRSFHRGCGALRDRRRSGSFRYRGGSHVRRRLNCRRCSRHRRSRRRGLFDRRRCGTRRARRFDGRYGLLGSAGMFLARGHSDVRLDHDGARGRSNHNHWPRCRCGTGRRLGNHGSSRGT
jgi:hypothetical protein